MKNELIRPRALSWQSLATVRRRLVLSQRRDCDSSLKVRAAGVTPDADLVGLGHSRTATMAHALRRPFTSILRIGSADSLTNSPSIWLIIISGVPVILFVAPALAVRLDLECVYQSRWRLTLITCVEDAGGVSYRGVQGFGDDISRKESVAVLIEHVVAVIGQATSLWAVKREHKRLSTTGFRKALCQLLSHRKPTINRAQA